MSESSVGRFIVAMATMIALTACTTTVEISYSGIRKVDAISGNFRTVATQQISDPLSVEAANGQDGFYLIELKSGVDIETIVRKREMAFLYYELRSCGKADKAMELYSAPAYVKDDAARQSADSFYYYAPVSVNYWADIDRYLAMQGVQATPRPTQICIGLGAGNMAGQNLKTNFVPITLD